MFQVWEDAVGVSFVGAKVYAYGLAVALGCLGCMALLISLGRLKKLKPGTVPLTGVLSLVCGFVISRLLFCLLDGALGSPLPLLAASWRLSAGGYSMMGALIGACLGAWAAATIQKEEPARVLDCMAPSLMLLVLGARLGERYIEDFGISRVLVGDFFPHTFLAVQGAYDSYLATYLLEAATAVVLCLVLVLDIKKQRRAGNTFLLALLLFGATQVIWESLRFDQHMRISFVSLQQIMAMMLVAAALIVLARRRWQTRHALAVTALVMIPAAVGLGVALEFAIDRTTVSRYLLYAIFVLVMAAPVAVGCKLRKE